MNRMLPSEIFGPSIIWCLLLNLSSAFCTVCLEISRVSGFKKATSVFFFFHLKGFPLFKKNGMYVSFAY